MMAVDRPVKLRIGTTELHLPVFFPSVSSIKTALLPLDYIRLINALSTVNNQFLVSAFDLGCSNGSERKLLKREITNAEKKGTVVLMDSGNYETFWKGVRDKWSPADFHRILKEFPCHLVLGFDEQQPPSDMKRHLRLIVDHHKQDQKAAASAKVIPIIHGKRDILPILCAETAATLGVEMVAVPERRLGDGLFERVQSVASIRQALNTQGRYVGLHLLGTGNPISLAIYSIVGADSFDGLEWCQTVVDYESALLFHLSQADFFTGQTRWGEENLPFSTRVLAHNLEFYTDWIARLRKAISDGRGVAFCRLNFPKRVFVQCAAALKWEA